MYKNRVKILHVDKNDIDELLDDCAILLYHKIWPHMTRNDQCLRVTLALNLLLANLWLLNHIPFLVLAAHPWADVAERHLARNSLAYNIFIIKW